jgi:hypothetical protein
VVKTSKTLTFPFNVFIDVRYHKIKVVGDKATSQASTTSLGKFVQKSMYYLLKKNKMC